MTLSVNPRVRRKAVWGSKAWVLSVLVLLAGVVTNVTAAPTEQHTRQAAKAKPGVPGANVKQYRLDDELTRRADDRDPRHTTRVIVTLVPGAQLPSEFKNFAKGRLEIINGQVLDLPNNVLRKLAAHPNVFRVHYDRPTKTHNYRTAVTVGARDVFAKYGYTGAGVGIAVIDSGIASWHDDMVNYTGASFPYGNQRVAKFVDFVNGRTLPYDDNGHGTHVSGIIGGVGYDSKWFEKAGIAPLASIISLKVLDQNGVGSVSRLIAALDWIAVNAKTYNIRVVNMSVGAGVYESYWTDPLTLAAKAVTDKGITVVTAAGNMGKNAAGQLQHGGITAPGNAPWVLTVGASSTMGTTDPTDDQMAGYSSSGPTAIDYDAKPDLVAPGTGTVSMAAAGSTFMATKAQFLVNGRNGLPVYLSLSGTSMAAPVVSGTVALMLQANPNLTPNLIKAILQYTATRYPGYSALRQGTGFLNTAGAVQLARFYAGKAGPKLVAPSTWSKSIIWGNQLVKGGYPTPSGNAWASNIVWGTALTAGTTGQNIVWGTDCADVACENIVWGTSLVDGLLNIVWGTHVTGGGLGPLNIVWGTSLTDTAENIVWGTDCGGADCENIVWGTFDALENIVWGTSDGIENIMWGTSVDGLLNIVWGTSTADVTWGSDSADAVTFPDESLEAVPTFDPTNIPSEPAPVDPVAPLDPIPVPAPPVGTLLTGGL